MSPDADLAEFDDLAAEVDATRRLTRIADELVAEIIARARRIERRIDELKRAVPESPSEADGIGDLGRVGEVHHDLLEIAEAICGALEALPRGA